MNLDKICRLRFSHGPHACVCGCVAHLAIIEEMLEKDDGDGREGGEHKDRMNMNHGVREFFAVVKMSSHKLFAEAAAGAGAALHLDEMSCSMFVSLVYVCVCACGMVDGKS